MRKRNDPLQKLRDNFSVIRLAPAAVLLVLFVSITLYTLSNTARKEPPRNDSPPAAATPGATGESPLKTQMPAGSHELHAGGIAGAEVGEIMTATYRGITFTYNTSLASEIKAETRPAYALQYETNTPHGAVPEHVVFEFNGPYAASHESSAFSPEITIYPIAGYRKALAKSQSYVRQFDDEINSLKTMLSTQPGTWEDDIPVMPFWLTSQRFHARMKYISFQNGRGVMFLTQYKYNGEETLVNNEALTYTFQGLTDDGIYYVSATFPVKAPFLPDHHGAEETDDYTLVRPRTYEGPEYEAFEKRHKIYLDKVINKLEALPPDDYRPSLILLEEAVRSLDVRLAPKARPGNGRG